MPLDVEPPAFWVEHVDVLADAWPHLRPPSKFSPTASRVTVGGGTTTRSRARRSYETPTQRACTIVPSDNADRLRVAPDACVANSSM